MANKPLKVFTIIDSDKLEKSIWRRIGSAFENRDKSLTVLLDAYPANGRLHIREDNDQPDTGATS